MNEPPNAPSHGESSQQSSPEQHRQAAPKSVTFCVLTVSDSRTVESDTSGQLIVDRMTAAGHQLIDRQIVRDEPDQIQHAVREMCLPSTNAILVTGGTGITSRDQTPEAVRPLLTVELPGFGEIFRWLSFQEIGAAAMLSRAFAGRIDSTLVFCLPGSKNAVRLAVEQILVRELPHLVHHARG